MCGDEEIKLVFLQSGWKKQKTEVMIFFITAALSLGCWIPFSYEKVTR